MKLATFLPPGGGEPLGGAVSDGVVVAFDPSVTVPGLLAEGGERPSADGPRYELDEVVLMAPHVPRAIFCIGLNYRRHAQETGREPPSAPIVFLKLPSSVAPPGGPVPRPPVVRRLDYEGELAVVMGRDGRVAGYTVADDVSARDLLFGIGELIAFIGETCTLEPGDLILTGTPDGVGMAMDPPQFLEPGDVVAIEIERLGRIEHPVV